jgi:hypothetical protein
MATCRGLQSLAPGSLEALMSRTVSVIAFVWIIIMADRAPCQEPSLCPI